MGTINYRSTFKTLILCQLSDNRNFQSYLQLYFLHFGVCHTVNCSILPQESVRLSEIWTHHILYFLRWFRHLLHSIIVVFRASRIRSTVGVDIPVDRSFQSYLTPEETVLPVNYRNWQRSSEPPQFCQQWEMTFLQLSELPNTWKALPSAIVVADSRQQL